MIMNSYIQLILYVTQGDKEYHNLNRFYLLMIFPK